MIADLIRRNRTYRRFDQSMAVDKATLRELVDLGRLSAAGGNKQPLKYKLLCEPDDNARMFPLLAWAGSLKDWDGPAEGERPAAYIVLLCDSDISRTSGCDHGIAAQTILLGAMERGIGGCMMGSINTDGLRAELDIPDTYEIRLVLALGTPAERVVVETIRPGGDIRYWRDDKGVHHVPKRPLDEIIVG